MVYTIDLGHMNFMTISEKVGVANGVLDIQIKDKDGDRVGDFYTLKVKDLKTLLKAVI